MKKKLKISFIIIFFILLLGILLGQKYLVKMESGKTDPDQNEQVKKEIKKDPEKKEKNKQTREQVRVEDLQFTRISSQEIRIFWSNQKDPYTSQYVIKRRKRGESEWKTLKTLPVDEMTDSQENFFVDSLENAMPQQYEYRVDVEVTDENLYEAVKGDSIFASNLLLCIDPGHYKGRNVIDTDGISYDEGTFTLELARELQKQLKELYGVTAYLTRESGTICIDGYTNEELDHGHISLRGEYAKGSDLFLSLHTNANREGANGYATAAQPVEIMKPIIIMNTIACKDQTARSVGNAIGERLAEHSYRLGIALPEKFHRVNSEKNIVQWSDEWNDDLDASGAICRRLSGDKDYYGVLKGAANVQVSGMIIEHGFHTVPEMRKLVSQGILQTEWAKADAEGIAKGLGLEAAE